MSETVRPIRPLVAGNWKMNGLQGALGEARALSGALSPPGAGARVDVMICPPATLLMKMAETLKGSRLLLGAQDCHHAPYGAHTGDVSAEMLRDAGASAVIVGHSERRAGHGETDRVVCAKAAAAYRAGLSAIVCIGETAGQRRAGLTLEIVRRQLSGSLPDGASSANTIIAYEPVWAIGTGLTPSPDDVAGVHAAVRAGLVGRLGPDGGRVRILYGGSVRPGNAKALLSAANVNGALVGAASLEAEDFLAIIRNYA